MVNAFTRSSKIMPSVSYCSVWLGHRKNTRTIFYRHPNGRILLQISGLISRESFPDKTSCLLNARTIKMSENDAYLYVIRNRQLNQSLIKNKEFCVWRALTYKISSLGSLFMKHRFFLFHTPIIALGKVFSTTCHYIHYALSLKYLLRLENHEGMRSVDTCGTRFGPKPS